MMITSAHITRSQVISQAYTTTSTRPGNGTKRKVNKFSDYYSIFMYGLCWLDGRLVVSWVGVFFGTLIILHKYTECDYHNTRYPTKSPQKKGAKPEKYAKPDKTTK